MEAPETREAIVAGGGNDTIPALGGNDALFGQAGNDFIAGGNDDDYLEATDTESGAGRGEIDRLSGGTGTDIFVLGEGPSIARNGAATAFYNDMATTTPTVEGMLG